MSCIGVAEVPKGEQEENGDIQRYSISWNLVNDINVLMWESKPTPSRITVKKTMISTS